MSTRPNILWICTEHQRFDTVNALGNGHIRTPNLDRLVREGVAFTHAFAQCSVCTPSRSSFLTGRYPVTTRCRQNGQNIPDDEILITRVLRDTGYDCGLAGKLHVSASAGDSERRIDDGYRTFEWSHGVSGEGGGDYTRWLAGKGKTFDDVYGRCSIPFSREVTDREHNQTTWCFDRTLAFVQEKRDRPWLMSVNPHAVHDPFAFLREYYDRYDPDTLPSPRFRPGELEGKPYPQQASHRGRPKGGFAGTTDRQRREMVAAYYATIEHIDHELGRALDWLDESGQRQNTLVIFMSDHGDMLGDHGVFTKGAFLYDPALRVPLIFSWPGRLPCDRQYDALVELVDVVPTLYDLLEMDIPVRVQGRSLMPVITGEISCGDHREGVYAEYYNANPAHTAPHRARTYATMWRDRRYKIVVYHGEELGELYDLEKDPDEFENRWDDPSYAEVRFSLTKKCFDARAFTMDPLPERVSNF